MNRYAKMYGWLHEAFGEEEFAIDEFKAVFPSPQPAKIIHDLIGSGYLARVKRGRYRVVPPDDFLTRIVDEGFSKMEIISKAERRFVYTGSDAVSLWTDGYYWTGFTKGFRPIYIKVLDRDLDYWRVFFRENNAECVLETDLGKRTLFGVMFVLHVVPSFEVEFKEDAPLIPLEEVVEFCRERELTYRPALEYLDGKYHLGIFKEKELEHVH
ncbi:MAG: hypothetical protein V3T58_07195 [Candidatus Hydrothermarchaeales archaeon]